MKLRQINKRTNPVHRHPLKHTLITSKFEMLSHETAPYTTDAEQNTLNNTANQQAANLINGCFTAQSAGERCENAAATPERPSSDDHTHPKSPIHRGRHQRI